MLSSRSVGDATLAILAGFVVGVGVSAFFKRTRKATRRNTRTRRTSARRRRRGRPSGIPVTERIVVKMPDGFVEVDIDHGIVAISGRDMGSVYDLGTHFRSTPFGGVSRSFGTLAGAVKHVIRETRAA